MIQKKLGFGIVTILGVALLGNAVPAAAVETSQDKETTADVTFSGSPLTLNAVSAISFGSQAIETQNETYAVPNGDQLKVSVSDGRGTLTGWRLTAQLAGFTNTSGAASLPESTMDFKDSRLTSSSINGSPTLLSSLSLESGATDPTLISSAADGAGGGLWEYNWAQGVGLDVLNGAATLGKHTSKITWTLIDAP